MQGHAFRLARCQHIAEHVPDVAPLAEFLWRQAEFPKLLIDRHQSRPVVPENAVLLGQPTEVLDGIEVFRLVGTIQTDDDIVEVSDLTKFVDDVTQCRPFQLRVEAGQHQRHRAVTGEALQFPLHVCQRARAYVV